MTATMMEERLEQINTNFKHPAMNEYREQLMRQEFLFCVFFCWSLVVDFK